MQHIVFASLVMTSVMPTFTLAMAKGHSSVAKRDATTKNTKQKQKMAKRPFWKRIDWEYWVAGGSVAIGIIALLWTMHNQTSVPTSNMNQWPAPRPNPHQVPTNYSRPAPAPRPNPQDPDVRIGKRECPICMVTGAVNMKAPCCGQEVCETCWNKDVYSGEYDIQIDDAGHIRKVRDKLPKQCPFCRADKK